MPAAIVDRARGAGTRPNSYPTTPPRCGAQLMRQPGLNSEQTSCGGGWRLWHCHCHSGSVTRMRFRCAVCEHDGASQNASAEAVSRHNICTNPLSSSSSSYMICGAPVVYFKKRKNKKRCLASILLCSKGGFVFRFGRRNFVQLIAPAPVAGTNQPYVTLGISSACSQSQYLSVVQ